MARFIDLSRIPVNKGTNSRLGWTRYSDFYEIVHPSLVLFFVHAHWSIMQERSIPIRLVMLKYTGSWGFNHYQLVTSHWLSCSDGSSSDARSILTIFSSVKIFFGPFRCFCRCGISLTLSSTMELYQCRSQSL